MMKPEMVATDGAPGAPGAIGPYSQAVRMGEWVFCSGQIALDPETQEVVSGSVREQTARVLDNLAAVLEASGSSLDRAMRLTVFLKDMNDFAVVNEVYATRFEDHRPARVTVEVSRLPKDVLVEIDCIAHADDEPAGGRTK